MKLVTWNCNGALRKKLKEVDSLGADILIIQECEDPARSTEAYKLWANNFIWRGKNKNKGIGIFARNNFTIRELNWKGKFVVEGFPFGDKATSWATKDLECFLPFSINNQYTVLGVWTKNSEGGVFGYMGQFWKYLQIHKEDLKGKNVIIAGDFNSNAIWDKTDRWWNHSNVVSELENMRINSLYHHRMQEDQGKESTPTLFLQKNSEKPYHIDYVFLSKNLLKKSNIKIGRHSDWISVSDHMPLITNISCRS